MVTGTKNNYMRAKKAYKVPDEASLKAREVQLKVEQKRNFDKHSGARDLPRLTSGDLVWMPDRGREAVVEKEVAPHLYTVNTPDGAVSRIRRDLIQVPDGQGTSRSSSGDNEEITE